MHSSTNPTVHGGPSGRRPKPAPLGKQARIAVAVLVVCALAALFWPQGSGTFKEPGGFLFDAEGQGDDARAQAGAGEPGPLLGHLVPALPRGDPLAAAAGHGTSPNHDDFGIVMVAVADETEKAEVFLGNWGTMALYDPNWDVAKRYGTDKLPETYLVVRGEVVKKFVGQTDWDDPELRELIAGRLRGPRRRAPAGRIVSPRLRSGWRGRRGPCRRTGPRPGPRSAPTARSGRPATA